MTSPSAPVRFYSGFGRNLPDYFHAAGMWVDDGMADGKGELTMTLEKAIRQLKELREYAKGEIVGYGAMDDDNPWVEDVKALDVAIKVMEQMQEREQ